MNERCLYCGRTKERLYLEFPEQASPLCNCCGHCSECKMLTLQHKFEQSTYRPKKEESPYVYLYNQKD